MPLVRPSQRLALELVQPELLPLLMRRPLPWAVQMPVQKMLLPPGSAALRTLQMYTAYRASSKCWSRSTRARAGPAFR